MWPTLLALAYFVQLVQAEKVTVSTGPLPTVELTVTATTTVSTTTTYGDAVSPCAAWTVCMSNHDCAFCVNAITGAATPLSRLLAQNVATRDDNIISVLLSEPSCAVNKVHPQLLFSALESLTGITTTPCGGMPRIYMCTLSAYACIVGAECRSCLSALRQVGLNSTKETILRSPACRSANYRRDLWSVASDCNNFPRCSFFKHICSLSINCSRCFAMYRRGDLVGAASSCKDSGFPLNATPKEYPSGLLLDMVVSNCNPDSATMCNYYKQRCRSHSLCNECWKLLGGVEDVNVVLAAMQSPQCVRWFTSDNSTEHPMTYIQTLKQCSLTVQNRCAHNVLECVITEPQCAACMSDAATKPVQCGEWLDMFNVKTSCRSCRDQVRLLNGLVVATSVVGGTAVLLTLLAVTAILAHRRHVAALRDRILVGLMLANMVYSIANVIPLALVSEEEGSCGQLFLSFSVIRSGRALWFGGKFGILGFEFAIITASLFCFLSGGQALRNSTEMVMYTGCLALGVAAFVAFYVRSSEVHSAGYNKNVLHQSLAFPTVSYLSNDDEFDDDFPANEARHQYSAGRNAYDGLVRLLLQVWLGMLALAVIEWGFLRLAYWQFHVSWQAFFDSITMDEERDEWALSRRSKWDGRKRAAIQWLNLCREILEPLEPYVWVFIVFGVPAVVMSTDYCQAHSTVSLQHARALSLQTDDVDFGLCNVACELALSFRTIVTVAVFLRDGRRRYELISVGGTLRKRLILWLRPLPASEDTQEESDGTPMTVLRLPPGSTYIDEGDLHVKYRLGEGTRGKVYGGSLKNIGDVAIKEIDISQPSQELDFVRECQALHAINHPNVLKLLGFGKMAGTNSAYIVTEVLHGGSLREFLHGDGNEVTWAIRVSYALQIATGMAALHRVNLMHRDLKSENVFLGASGRVVVGDLGSARQFNVPKPPLQIVSRFTGSVQEVDGDEYHTLLEEMGSAQRLPSEHSAMTMTQGVGSLLWMAPETLRKDSVYDGSVDVYSFGILMWELAFQKLPWELEFNLMGGPPGNEFPKRLLEWIRDGIRPRTPPHVVAEHPEFVQTMRRCWAGDSAMRPHFDELVEPLAGLLRHYRQHELSGEDSEHGFFETVESQCLSSTRLADRTSVAGSTQF